MSSVTQLVVYVLIFLIRDEASSQQTCEVTTSKLKSAPKMFEIHDKLLHTDVWKTIVHGENNCTLDISAIAGESCNGKDDVVMYVNAACKHKDTRLRITNEKNLFCSNYVGYLHIGNCGVYWQDLDIYGKSMALYVLYLQGYKDLWQEELELTDYWNDYIHSETNGTLQGNSSGMPQITVSPGLRLIGTMALTNMDSFPPILTTFVWPNMAEIELFNIPFPEPYESLSVALPHLQSFEPIACQLTELPTNFPWTDDPWRLPRNLSRTRLMNTHYSDAFDIVVQRMYYRRIMRFDKNNITDLTNFTFHGNLQYISLKQNQLSALGKDLFVHTKGLRSVHLQDNQLTNIPSSLFRNLTSLVTVSLRNNLLTDIPEGLFGNLPSLKKVDLSENSLISIKENIFIKLPALQSVNLAHNDIEFLSNDAIPLNLPDVKHIDLSHNRITFIPTFIFVLRKLESADLSSNRITFSSIIESLSVISSEHLLNAHLKSASQFDEDETENPYSTSDIKFWRNNISSLDLDDERNDNQTVRTISLFFHFFNVDLEDNDFLCDCKVFEFYKHMHGEVQVQGGRQVNQYNKENLKCNRPPDLHGKLLYDLVPKDFLCPEQIPLCPSLCTCYRRSVDKAVIVNCQQVGMIALPSNLPPETVELDLSDNAITSIDQAPTYFSHLQKLDLHNNRISSIARSTLDALHQSQLNELRLDHNRLCDIPENVNIFKDTSLSSLTMSNNPWKCDCQTSWMKNWLIVRRGIIEDLDELMCVTGIPAGQVYIEVKEEDFICETPAMIIVRNALLCVGSVVVLIAIICIFLYIYRGEIKILMYVHFNWHPFDAAEDADILDMHYDAFISYSGLDYKWVCFDLLPKLENHTTPYKVCVHDRDFMPGAYIEDNIMEAVQCSRRMILVLSKNYLQSDWCMLEFRAAHNKVLNDRTNYLILVLFDDVNVDDLDEDMQLYIRTNTYLARSNKWFYEKIFYSMPTKNLTELRQEMETKSGKVPLQHALKFTANEQMDSPQSSLDTVETVTESI